MIQEKPAVRLFFMVLMLLLYSSLVEAREPIQIELDKALVAAAAHGDLAKVKALLEQGANINGIAYAIGDNPLMSAIEEGKVNVVNYLLEEGALQKPNMLGQAAGSGYVEIVKILIRYGADVDYTDKWGHNALYWAQKNLEAPRTIIPEHRDQNRKLEEVIRVLKAAGAR